jgi:hypothetical protein
MIATDVNLPESFTSLYDLLGCVEAILIIVGQMVSEAALVFFHGWRIQFLTRFRHL